MAAKKITLAERARVSEELKLIIAILDLSQASLAHLYQQPRQVINRAYHAETSLPDSCLGIHRQMLRIAETQQAYRRQATAALRELESTMQQIEVTSV